jgi:hypothetical protein
MIDKLPDFSKIFDEIDYKRKIFIDTNILSYSCLNKDVYNLIVKSNLQKLCESKKLIPLYKEAIKTYFESLYNFLDKPSVTTTADILTEVESYLVATKNLVKAIDKKISKNNSVENDIKEIRGLFVDHYEKIKKWHDKIFENAFHPGLFENYFKIAKALNNIYSDADDIDKKFMTICICNGYKEPTGIVSTDHHINNLLINFVNNYSDLGFLDLIYYRLCFDGDRAIFRYEKTEEKKYCLNL